ncbi:hypothetical protein GWI72_06525 [Microvirga tunisiensis]|uniref:Uncharacterized protein n=1 Tax=Pannonibacter tanglangensis TaxID=2750084 RepID=A0A7X5J8J0_9HYPH|nr:hypothetical protein [Pannonibacter sp. XCT-53]NBN77922.1 hypothetical protein [Pannonibacter sp. XCT-53]
MMILNSLKMAMGFAGGPAGRQMLAGGRPDAGGLMPGANGASRDPLPSPTLPGLTLSDELVEDIKSSVETTQNLQRSMETAKDGARRDKIARLQERIEQLKERIRYATPQQAKALMKELKQLAKEFKGAAKELGSEAAGLSTGSLSAGQSTGQSTGAQAATGTMQATSATSQASSRPAPSTAATAQTGAMAGTTGGTTGGTATASAMAATLLEAGLGGPDPALAALPAATMAQSGPESGAESGAESGQNSGPESGSDSGTGSGSGSGRPGGTTAATDQGRTAETRRDGTDAPTGTDSAPAARTQQDLRQAVLAYVGEQLKEEVAVRGARAGAMKLERETLGKIGNEIKYLAEQIERLHKMGEDEGSDRVRRDRASIVEMLRQGIDDLNDPRVLNGLNGAIAASAALEADTGTGTEQGPQVGGAPLLPAQAGSLAYGGAGLAAAVTLPASATGVLA